MRPQFPDEEEYQATIPQWEEFIKGPIWHDLQLFLLTKYEFQGNRLALTHEERANTEGSTESDDMIRGRLREALDLMNAPEAILHELADQQELEEEK